MALNDQERQLFIGSGIAAYLPGMRYLMDQMAKLVGMLEAELAAAQQSQQNPAQPAQGAARRGRPRKVITVPETPRRARDRAGASKGYWASMTPEERSAEMTRRMEVHRQKLKHQRRSEAGRRTGKEAWRSLTVKQRKERIANMNVARLAKRAADKLPVVTLEKSA